MASISVWGWALQCPVTAVVVLDLKKCGEMNLKSEISDLKLEIPKSQNPRLQTINLPNGIAGPINFSK
jgi:hypothetical protein